MQKLDTSYQKELDGIAKGIQESDHLKAYLDSEEEEHYRALIEEHEPAMHELYQKAADNHPMQLLDLEDRLLDARYEGLYMPRLLGYTVLRGVVNENYKYIMPQEQFRKVLLAISNSINFDLISLRIGQTVQIGFALSSDIWITNLLNEIPNKRVRNFLISQKLMKYREYDERRFNYLKYKKQFESYNFYTAEFPDSKAQMHILYPALKDFLVHRIMLDRDNSNLHPYIKDFAENESLRDDGMEYVYLLGLMTNYFSGADEKVDKALAEAVNGMRKKKNDFVEIYFEFLRELLNSKIPVKPECDHRMSKLLDQSIKDDFTKYYNLTDIIHSKGYIHEDTIEAIQKFYYQHEGLSTINECIRLTILNYFRTILENLEETDYQEYFELNKIFTRYINIFSNQEFNQSVKDLSLAYIRRLIKHFTDKRGKDYQDIKKFVMATFVDLGFSTEKEIAEVFKTRRRRRKKSTA